MLTSEEKKKIRYLMARFSTKSVFESGLEIPDEKWSEVNRYLAQLEYWTAEMPNNPKIITTLISAANTANQLLDEGRKIRMRVEFYDV